MRYDNNLKVFVIINIDYLKDHFISVTDPFSINSLFSIKSS